jgi:hypothetical protein
MNATDFFSNFIPKTDFDELLVLLPFVDCPLVEHFWPIEGREGRKNEGTMLLFAPGEGTDSPLLLSKPLSVVTDRRSS